MRKFLLFIMVAVSCMAQSSGNVGFDKATKFYVAQQYDSALKYYQTVESSGLENASLFYNMAESWFRLVGNGQAIRYWEKCLALNPSDADAKANLALVRSRIVDRVAEPSSDFLGMVVLKVHDLMPLNVQLIVTAVIIWIVALLFAGWLFAKKQRVFFGYFIAVAMLPLLYTIPSAAVKIHDKIMLPQAVVIVSELPVVNEPYGRTTLFTVHEGTLLTIRKSENGCLLVSLPNGSSGWVADSTVGKI